jgi:hypothetical protein
MTNAIKVLLQMTSVSLQPVPSLFKIATLTLEMYYGLHFQFRRAHYHS